MNMSIDKTRCDGKSGKIQNFFSILWSKVFTKFGDKTILS